MKARWLFALLFVPAASAALYGCPSPSDTHEEELADVIYQGAVTDEALTALDSAVDQKGYLDDATRAPALDAPAGTSFPKGTIPTFAWHFGASSFRAPPPPAPGGPALLRFADASSPWRGALSQLIGPPRAAHAHGDPFTGTGTFLTFATKSDPKLLRLFTSSTGYTPAQDHWDKLVAAGAEITLTLVAADFDNNRIADGGDPVKGSELTFTITE